MMNWKRNSKRRSIHRNLRLRADVISDWFYMRLKARRITLIAGGIPWDGQEDGAQDFILSAREYRQAMIDICQ